MGQMQQLAKSSDRDSALAIRRYRTYRRPALRKASQLPFRLMTVGPVNIFRLALAKSTVGKGGKYRAFSPCNSMVWITWGDWPRLV